MLIKITPFDTLFFRDGKPFNMGDETWTDGIFPPYPSVFYGALRTLYFANHIDEFKKVNTEEDPTKNLKIKNIFYRIHGCNFYPIPLDLVEIKSKKQTNTPEKEYGKEYEREYEVVNLKISEQKIISSKDEKLNMLYYDDEVMGLDDGVISKGDLHEYLAGKLENATAEKISDNIKKESKISIKKDRLKGNSEDGKLYRLDLLRLVDFDICVEFEGIDIPDRGYLKIGGENKAAYYMRIDKYPGISSKLKDGKFKLYINTPAIFKKGWLPEWVNSSTYEGNFKGINLKLITAAVGRYNLIGGFSMKDKNGLPYPKPMRRAVPAGSVYYFETDEKDMDKIVNTFNGVSISEFDTSKEGFGICYVGGWK